jgi:Flp pilus assembly protein TadG
MMSMLAHFRALARDQRGAAVIELALAAPLMATLLIGLVDLSTAYSDKLRLEQVAQRTVEKVQQKSFKPADETTLESEAQTEAGSGATADVTYWLECNGVRQTGSSAYANGCSSGQENSRYVQVDIQKTYTPIILARFAGSSTTGTFTLHGIAGIRIL